MKHLRLALPIVILLLWAEPAPATTVAIVWPPTRSEEVNQVLTLLRGELLSAGLDIAMAERSSIPERAGGDGQVWLEGYAARGISAVVDTIGDDALEALDVWILKTPPQRFEVTRVALEPDAANQPAMLALRAFEALRAGLVQMDWAARKPHDKPIAKQPVVTVATEVAPKSEPYRQRVGVEVGAVANGEADERSARGNACRRQAGGAAGLLVGRELEMWRKAVEEIVDIAIVLGVIAHLMNGAALP